MEKFWILLLLLASEIAVLSHAEQLTDDGIIIAGSSTTIQRVLEPLAEDVERASGKRLDLFSIGTARGLLELVRGGADAAAVSTSLASARAAAESVDPDIKLPEDLRYHRLAEDKIVLIVHRDNPVRMLTMEQLEGIYSGDIQYWSELGGESTEVEPLMARKGSGTNRVFIDAVLNGREVARGARYLVDNRAVILGVSASPDTIGFVSLHFYKRYAGKTARLEGSEISRPLGLVTVGSPSSSVKALLDYLNSDLGRFQLDSYNSSFLSQSMTASSF